LGGPVAAIGPNRHAQHFNVLNQRTVRPRPPPASSPVIIIYGADESSPRGHPLEVTSLGALFRLVPPPAIFYAFLVGVVAAYMVTVELVKAWFYRRYVQPLPVASIPQ